MRYSLGILKPDCLKRGLAEVALNLVKSCGLRVIFSKKIILNTEDAKFLYSRCAHNEFFLPLVKFMSSGEVVIFVVESFDGECAIKRLNTVTGHTNPADAKPGTLRSLGVSLRENIAHSTADENTFWAEISYFLTKVEMDEMKLGS